jgi:hypothetical protein
MEAKTKEINGHNYEVSPFPARHAFKLKAELLRKLGPGLAAMVGAAKGDSLANPELDGAALATGVEALFSNLGTSDEIMALVEDIVRMTRRDGKEITGASIDLDFQGQLSDLYKVVWFVLEVNYGDFFEGASFGGLGELMKSKIASSISGSPTG